MYLTKSEAVRLHRLLWDTIADEIEKTDKRVTKREALKLLGYDPKEILCECFCCEYTEQKTIPVSSCHLCCPIIWGEKDCINNEIYKNWNLTKDPIFAAALARQIANLPERSDEDFDILE